MNDHNLCPYVTNWYKLRTENTLLPFMILWVEWDEPGSSCLGSHAVPGGWGWSHLKASLGRTLSETSSCTCLMLLSFSTWLLFREVTWISFLAFRAPGHREGSFQSLQGQGPELALQYFYHILSEQWQASRDSRGGTESASDAGVDVPTGRIGSDSRHLWGQATVTHFENVFKHSLVQF